jgi:hypothetical protein
MKKSEIIEFLREYLEENQISPEKINLPKDNQNKRKDMQSIKQDPLLFSDLFIVFYNEFRRQFKDCTNLEVRKILEVNGEIVMRLIDLKSYRFRKIDYGRGLAERVLIGYTQERYFDIMDFLDLCMEVYFDDGM